MRRSKQILEDNLVLFKNKVNIYKEKNNTFYFESNNPKLYFLTNDYLEAVSALMKLKEMRNFDNLWNISITSEMKKSVDISRCLYWLTGGDKDWRNKQIYTKSWRSSSKIYLIEYKDRINKILNKCETLGEVRDEFLKYLTLPKLYEFSLNKGLII